MSNRKDDIKARLMTTFGVEAREHLQAITANHRIGFSARFVAGIGAG